MSIHTESNLFEHGTEPETIKKLQTTKDTPQAMNEEVKAQKKQTIEVEETNSFASSIHDDASIIDDPPYGFMETQDQFNIPIL